MPISKLSLQNALALATLPFYLLLRPLLRLFAVLGRAPRERWIVGGHSGRIYADNAAALHALLLESGRDVTWISAAPTLTAMLKKRGARVLRRNSLVARIALENASVLAYSHGVSDLDHVLARCVPLRGLKIHLNHCMNHLKGPLKTQALLRPGAEARTRGRARRSDAFDYLLASSERERLNFARLYPGREAQIVLGGGAHLDAFMRARGQPPARIISYFPTFRDGAVASAALEAQIDALVNHPGLLAFLEREGFQLCVVGHVNREAASDAKGRVRMVAAQDLLDVVLRSALLISDYSGLICDYLALDRPTLFFPFDKDEYLRTREMYVDYDAFAFGPVTYDVEALVALITQPSLQRPEALEARRRYWERELFPDLAPVYAQRTLDTIEALACSRSDPRASTGAQRTRGDDP